MSHHHENIVWQSPDGTWNRGFFTRLPCGGDDCEDETHEWCDEFDQDSFEWVSSGHATMDDAHRSWRGSNPGGFSVIGLDDGPGLRAEIDRLEDLAATKYEQFRATPRDRYSWGFDSRGYEGPPRSRTLAALQAEHQRLTTNAFTYRLGGYANLPDAEIGPLGHRIDDLLAAATPEQVAAYEDADKAHRERLAERLASARERRREAARFRGGFYTSNYAEVRAKNEREAAAEAEIAALEEAAVARAKRRRTPSTRSDSTSPATPKTQPKTTSGGRQGRQPKGVPTGGQFAASERGESAVSLDASSGADLPDPWS